MPSSSNEMSGRQEAGTMEDSCFLLNKIKPQLFSLFFNFTFHHKVWRPEPGALEKQVKIGPLEHQFGHMVHLCILEQIQRTNSRKGVLSGQWFGVVVEVDDVGFPEA